MTVVTDTSVILNLCWLGKQDLIVSLFGDVLAPPQVKAEFDALTATDPRFIGITFPSWVKVEPIHSIAPALIGESGLDQGELAALSLALEREISDVLIDERAARAVALALGMRSVGVLGILIRSKTMGLLPAVMPLIGKLKNDAGFWISHDLCERIRFVVEE